MSKSYSPYSELKIFHHTDRIESLIKGERPAPIYVRVKPTNICNQKCYYCAYADNNVFNERTVDNRESIPWDIMQGLIDDFIDIGVKGVTFTGGGEPLCYKNILELLEKVQSSGIDYSMITNGQALKGDVVEPLRFAKWIRISLDAGSDKTYNSIRGVNTFDRVLSNINEFADNKDKTCTLGINCVISENNFNEVFEICKSVKDAGANNIKLSPMVANGVSISEYHSKIKDEVLNQINRAKTELTSDSFHVVDKYTGDLRVTEDFEKTYNRCYIQEFFTVIGADCKIYRCHQRAYTKAGEVGDLRERSFKELWYDKDFINHVRNYDTHKMCRFRCAFDERNELLNDFMGIDREHVNFI